MVISVWALGMSHFEGNDYQQVLADIFCYALRDGLLDELEGVTRPAASILQDIISRVQPAPPAEAMQALRKFSPADFGRSLKNIRTVATEKGVDLGELADALKIARHLVKEFA